MNHAITKRGQTGGNASAILAALAAIACGLLLAPSTARAAGLTLPPTATQGLNLLYSGESAKAIEQFRQIETASPESPLGYLLEAEARWWEIYCDACEIKWNMIDAWAPPRGQEDTAYFALTDKSIRLAQDHIRQADSAEMELYAGMGWLLRARLLALRDERRATAQAGVAGRARLLRCLELDPQMSDAYTGLGLYDYYVDTLSGFAKALRFFMGIPGGKKKDGLRQLRIAMQQGMLTRVEARFYLAKNLRNYDRDYATSIEIMSPLAAEFPANPIFQLLLGDTEAKLAHQLLAAGYFRAAERLPVADAACGKRVREIAQQALMALPPDAGQRPR